MDGNVSEFVNMVKLWFKHVQINDLGSTWLYHEDQNSGKFTDIKWIIRSNKSKRRQHNGQKRQIKRSKGDLPNTTQPQLWLVLNISYSAIATHLTICFCSNKQCESRCIWQEI